MATPIKPDIATKEDYALRPSVPSNKKQNATEFNLLVSSVRANYERLILDWTTDVVINTTLLAGQYIRFTDNFIYRITTGYNVGNPLTWVSGNAVAVNSTPPGEGVTRELDRTFSEELLFDKNEIEGIIHVQTDAIIFSIAELGNLANQWSVYGQRIQTDGINPINFVGFNHIANFTNGDILDAGTYQFIMWYSNGIARVSLMLPSQEAANLDQLSSPGSFAAVADGDDEIDLSWAAVANASNFEIQYSLTGGSGPWSALTNPASGATTYSHTGLSAGTTYHYRIRAVGDQITFANSAWSIATATTTSTGDVMAPTFVFSPADTATDIPVNGVMTITASEALIDDDGVTEITNANVANYLVVKVNNGAGADIPFIAAINAAKTIITVTPNVVWPSEGNVFIQIDGVEDVNGNESVADSATFTTNDYTLAVNNYLDFSDILNPLFSANDTKFKLYFTAEDLIITDTAKLIFRKYVSPTPTSFILQQVGTDLEFKFHSSVGSGTEIRIRTIFWDDCLTAGEHTYRVEYDGTIDTNNGLDRLSLYIDGVLQGDKSVVSSLGSTDWPFAIRSSTAPLRIGPVGALVKDLRITSGDTDVEELNVPVMRTGLDTSGNGRNGTWITF